MNTSKIITLFCALLAFQSCLFQEENSFDAAATERVIQANELCRKTLVSSPYGWKLAYDSNDNSCTRFFLKFSDDETVSITSDLSTIANTKPAVSQYLFLRSQGPVLSFGGYNEYLSSLANPTSSNTTKGGDNDFIIMETTPDSIVLKGVKSQRKITLHKANEGDEAGYYVNNSIFKNFFKKASTSPFFMNLVFGDGSGVDMVTESNSRYVTFIYQDASSQTRKDRLSFDFNATGFNIWTPIVVGGKSHTNFVWNSTQNNYNLSSDAGAKFVFSHTTAFPYGKTVDKFNGKSYFLVRDNASYSDWVKNNVFNSSFNNSNDWKVLELVWNVKNFSYINLVIPAGTSDPNNYFAISGSTKLRDDQVSFQASGEMSGVNASKLSKKAYFKRFLDLIFGEGGFTVYEESGYMYLIGKTDSTRWLRFQQADDM